MQRPCANVYVHQDIYTVMCDTVMLGLAYIYDKYFIACGTSQL